MTAPDPDGLPADSAGPESGRIVIPGQTAQHPVPGVTPPSLRVMRTQEVVVSVYPSPSDMAAYQKADPEFARQILAHCLASNDRQDEEARREAEHDRQMELAYHQAEVSDRREVRRFQQFGQRAAVGVTAGGFLLCTVALFSPYPQAAVWIGCTMLVALVTSFLGGNLLARNRRSELDPPPAPNRPASTD